MSSTRLPGKVLAPLAGQPMLARMIERVQRAQCLDQIVVATSREDEDNEVAVLCEEMEIECYRGSLKNVLERYSDAARSVGADLIVRLTADCPLTDPSVINDLVLFFEEGSYDYASNTLEPTWPHGLDAEIFSSKSLEIAGREAVDPDELEHVTPHFYNNPDRFRLGSLKREPDLSQYRWTVDYPEDLQMVACVYEELYLRNPEFTTDEIIYFLRRHTEVRALNSHFKTRVKPRAPITST